MAVVPVTSVLRGWGVQGDRQVPGTHEPVSLDKIVSRTRGSVRDPVSNTRRSVIKERYPISTSGPATLCHPPTLP